MRNPTDPPSLIETLFEFLIMLVFGLAAWVIVLFVVRPAFWVLDRFTPRAS